MPSAADVADHTSRPGPAARSGPWRWLAVAAGCAALVTATMAAAPSAHLSAADPAPAAGGGAPKALPAGAAPDAAKAALPLDCGPLPATVTLSFAADLGDGTPATVAAAHCAAGAGAAPDGVFVITAGPGGTPRVHDVLVDWHQDYTVTGLALRADGTITAQARGYSTADVPRCCPDLTVQLDWTRHGDAFTRTEHSVPSATT
ncbi:hypothetical protein LN042_10525 [Kitasatospora sp. RB6PN24]|uniref:hypothetical protein n=1 Tax=Kitasatospora humi TaxID=2893891 RepID=UPI001E63E459|nr:hypothetical protein [Kitasatospora humi]MCC9307532.1 hypothetical protein [Kitasatospora humi]